MRKVCSALGAIALLLALSPASASAAALQPGGPDEAGSVDQELVLFLLQSPDPDAAMKELSPAQRREVAEVIEANLVEGETITESGPLTPAEASEVGLKVGSGAAGSITAAAASGCWYHYYYTGWTLWGMTTAHSWMQLNWCGSGGSITSSSITNVGGSATIINYAGNTKDKLNVGWEVRGVTTHKYTFSLVSVTKCMQIRGGATGLYSRSISCNLS